MTGSIWIFDLTFQLVLVVNSFFKAQKPSQWPHMWAVASSNTSVQKDVAMQAIILLSRCYKSVKVANFATVKNGQHTESEFAYNASLCWPAS